MSKPSPENTRLLERFAAVDALCVNDLLDTYGPDEARTRVDDLVRFNYIEQIEIYWNTFVTTEISDSIPYRITVAGRDFLEARQQAAQKVADDKANAEAKEAAKDAQAVINRKKQFRHDFKVAAFSVMLAFFIEHYSDIVNLFKRLLEAVRLLIK